MKYIRLSFFLLSLIVLLIAGFYFWIQTSMNNQIEHEKSATYITIEQGSSANQILNVLEKNKIIEGTLAPKLYLRFLEKKVQLEAGDYLFPSPISPKEALNELKNGKRRSKMLTIPEGWTRFEIAKRLVAQLPTVPALTEREVLKLMDNTELIQEFDPQAANLEGYLYPTTYDLEIGTHPKTAINRMVQEFKRNWESDWDNKAKKMGKTKREIVTIASLIENESKVDKERSLISSVIYNRIDQRIPLGIDATNVYIAKLLNRWDGIIHKSDVEIEHPYNTRKIQGLPPGPICSPSKSAFQAALKPENTKYLYYVLNVKAGDGSHNFYSTAAGFSRGKAEYQKWLAKQRGN